MTIDLSDVIAPYAVLYLEEGYGFNPPPKKKFF